MKTLNEIKQIYEAKVEAKVEKEGLSIGHSRYDIKDDVLSELVEEEFGGELPKDKEIRKWFENECHVVAVHINTECF